MVIDQTEQRDHYGVLVKPVWNRQRLLSQSAYSRGHRVPLPSVCILVSPCSLLHVWSLILSRAHSHMTTIHYRSGSTRIVPKTSLIITVTGEVVCIGGPEGRSLCQLLVLEFGVGVAALCSWYWS